jgi:hypothetical protein
MNGWRGTVLAGLTLAAGVLGATPAAAGDPNPAMSRPDQVAWELMAQIVRPTGNGGVAFESWASDADTFVDAPRWPDRPRKVLINRVQPPGNKQPGAISPARHCAVGHVAWCIGKESLRNRPGFDFIVDNGLTTRRGLAAFFGKTMDFPVDTVEVKAEWLPVSELKAWNGVSVEEAASFYHINSAAFGDDTMPVALVALHITTKLVPNWTWATFEHWKNPGRCDDDGCRDTFGSEQPVIAANRKTESGYDRCAPSAALRHLFAETGVADIWLNYCLKGTQTDFVTSTGEPTRLGNSVAETINAGVPHGRSSCITCHAEAAFDKDGRTAKADPRVGAPLPKWFIGAGTRDRPQFRQADFVWAIPFCAKPDDAISPCVPADVAKATAAR